MCTARRASLDARAYEEVVGQADVLIVMDGSCKVGCQHSQLLGLACAQVLVQGPTPHEHKDGLQHVCCMGAGVVQHLLLSGVASLDGKEEAGQPSRIQVCARRGAGDHPLGGSQSMQAASRHQATSVSRLQRLAGGEQQPRELHGTCHDVLPLHQILQNVVVKRRVQGGAHQTRGSGLEFEAPRSTG